MSCRGRATELGGIVTHLQTAKVRAAMSSLRMEATFAGLAVAALALLFISLPASDLLQVLVRFSGLFVAIRLGLLVVFVAAKAVPWSRVASTHVASTVVQRRGPLTRIGWCHGLVVWRCHRPADALSLVAFVVTCFTLFVWRPST